MAMEYIEPDISITKSASDVLTLHRDRWTEELKHLVGSFHAIDLVHDDLRDANIICKGEKVMLIDFDWGGKVGEVFYPTLDLNPELLEGRTSDGFGITKDDDVRVLTMTLGKLCSVVHNIIMHVHLEYLEPLFTMFQSRTSCF